MSIVQQKITRMFAWVAALFVLYGVTLDAFASVQVVKLDPPRLIGAWDLESDQDTAIGIGLVAVDFNMDGQVDARITHTYADASLYLDYPTRFVTRRQFYPWTTNIYGDVGALPLGTVIGSNLITTLDTHIYIWHVGATNRFADASLPHLGDHKSNMFGFFDSEIIGQPLSVFGDLAGKEAVIGVQFLIGTNSHYGYIHCDFRNETGWGYGGTGGYVLGWAYETEADQPIVAAPIAVSPALLRCGIHSHGGGLLDLTWNATPGATFRLQGTPVLGHPFTDFTPDFVIRSGSSAASVVQILTIEAPTNAPAYFWRVMRVK